MRVGEREILNRVARNPGGSGELDSQPSSMARAAGIRMNESLALREEVRQKVAGKSSAKGSRTETTYENAQSWIEPEWVLLGGENDVWWGGARGRFTDPGGT